MILFALAAVSQAKAATCTLTYDDDGGADEVGFINSNVVQAVKLFVPGTTPSHLCSISFQVPGAHFEEGEAVCLIAAVVADNFSGGSVLFERIWATASAVDDYVSATLQAGSKLTAGSGEAFLIGMELSYRGYSVDTSIPEDDCFLGYDGSDLLPGDDLDLTGSLMLRAGILSGSPSPATRRLTAPTSWIWGNGSVPLVFLVGGSSTSVITTTRTALDGLDSIDLECGPDSETGGFSVTLRATLEEESDLGHLRFSAVFADGSTGLAEIEVRRLPVRLWHDVPPTVGGGSGQFNRDGNLLTITLGYEIGAGVKELPTDAHFVAANDANLDSDDDDANLIEDIVTLELELEAGENDLTLAISPPGFPDVEVEVSVEVLATTPREDLQQLVRDLRTIEADGGNPNHEDAGYAADKIDEALTEEVAASLVSSLEDALVFLDFEEAFEETLATAAVASAGDALDDMPGLPPGSDAFGDLADAETALGTDDYESAMSLASDALDGALAEEAALSPVVTIEATGTVRAHAPYSLTPAWTVDIDLAYGERPTGAIAFVDDFVAIASIDKVYILDPLDGDLLSTLAVAGTVALSAQGDLLALGTKDGISVYDLSTPSSPSAKGGDSGDPVIFVDIHDALLIFYGGFLDDAIHQLTRANSGTSFSAASDLASVGDWVTSLCAAGGPLIVGCANGDIQTLDEVNGDVEDGPIETEGTVQSTSASSTSILAVSSSEGLLVYDSSLESVTCMEMPEGVVALRIAGFTSDRAWLASSSRIYLVDLTEDPPEVLHDLVFKYPLAGACIRR